jgi:cbb3-type cytochrome c oxidase subunit III
MIPPDRLKKGPTISFWKLFLILASTLAIFGGIILIFVTKSPKSILKVKPIRNAEIAAMQADNKLLENGYIQFQLRCARCHGDNLDGGLEGPSLIDNEWIYGNTAESIHRVITLGIPSKGMPAWGNQLQEEDIKALTAVIINLSSKSNSEKTKQKS